LGEMVGVTKGDTMWGEGSAGYEACMKDMSRSCAGTPSKRLGCVESCNMG